MSVNNPLYVVLLLAHATAALIGFGSVALSGLYAGRIASGTEEADRFFASRRLVAKSMVWATGVLGVVLLALNDKGARLLSYPWLHIAVADYVLAAAFVALAIWPLETRIREALAEGETGRERAVAAGRALVARSLVSDVALILAAVLMVTQPGR